MFTSILLLNRKSHKTLENTGFFVKISESKSEMCIISPYPPLGALSAAPLRAAALMRQTIEKPHACLDLNFLPLPLEGEHDNKRTPDVGTPTQAHVACGRRRKQSFLSRPLTGNPLTPFKE